MSPAPTLSLHLDTETTWRGGPHQVLLTVTGLRAAGHRAVLVCHPASELFRRMREGVDLVPLAAHSDADVAAAWSLSRVLKQIRPDLIHAHDERATAVAALAVSIVAPRPRPALVSSHRTATRLPHTSFGRFTIAEVDAYIANCRATAGRLRTDGVPPGTIHVVHEGVDVERIEHLPTAQLHADLYLPHDAPIVGTVAPLLPQKGLHHFIAAAALAVRAVPDMRAVIVGDGPLRHALEQDVRERHLERHVFLAGFRHDVIEVTKAFDVFAVSSLAEGMCTALVDAMAAGRPAVVTDVGGIPEVAVDGETALFVPARDEEAMGSALVRLLKDGALRQRMGAAARVRARDLFHVDRMLRDTIEVYRLALESARQRRPTGTTQGAL